MVWSYRPKTCSVDFQVALLDLPTEGLDRRGAVDGQAAAGHDVVRQHVPGIQPGAVPIFRWRSNRPVATPPVFIP